jgi:phosphoribosylformylglycinamidine cyclo-ligase
MSSNEYLDRGVSATKDDVHRAIAKHSAGEVPGAFCKVIADPAGDPQMLAVMHADGAGTKSSVAYLLYAETGDASAFRGIAQDSLVMNTDDLLCVGATTGLLVSNTIGRNAHRVKGDVISALIDGYEACAEMLRGYGVEITLTGGETADVGDLVRTVIADSTVFARVPRAAVGDFSRVEPGDLIIGLSSTGKAAYESDESSGIGSNGLTLARHALLAHSYAERFPESFSETIPADKVYCGRFQLGDTLPGTTRTVAWGLLSPTRTYLPVVRTSRGSCIVAVAAKPSAEASGAACTTSKIRCLPRRRCSGPSPTRVSSTSRCTRSSTWAIAWSCTYDRPPPKVWCRPPSASAWPRKWWDRSRPTRARAPTV